MLDAILILLLVVYGAQGISRGLVQTSLTVAGAVLGLWLGVWLGPFAMSYFDTRVAKQTAAIVAVACAVIIFALVGSVVGELIRRKMANRVVSVFDRICGGVVALVVTALVMWGGLGVVRSGGLDGLNQEIDQSKVYAALEENVPIDASALTLQFRLQLKEYGSPLAFVGNELIVPVPAPESTLPVAVQKIARASTVRIEGMGAACTTGQAGSGWVIAANRVMTNAHVVAGLQQARVQVGGEGRRYAATVVYFDPKTDVAILAVPDLPAPAVKIGAQAAAASDAYMVGFPFDGAYDEQALRVRSVQIAAGLDVYDQPGVEREVYSLRGLVRPGNSGGPLFNASGEVVGMIFAKSAVDAETGYALTPSEFVGLRDKAAGLVAAVDTKACLEPAGQQR